MKYVNFFFVIILSILLHSCFVEQHIAYSYQSELHSTPILFQNSAEVYLTNSKGEFPENVSLETTNYNYDSAYYESEFIHNIDPFKYKNDFANHLLSNLQSNELNIFGADSIVPFINMNKPRMIVDIVQVEVEEYYDIYYDEIDDMPAYFNATNKYLHIADADLDSKYRYDGLEQYSASIELPRNGLIVHLWLHVDLWLEDSVHESTTLFMDYVVSDHIEGKFIMENLQNPKYLYTIDSLDSEDLWKVAEFPAKIFANNIIDYLVNNMVAYRYYIKQDRAPTYNWKYIKSSGLIMPSEDDLPYLILEEGE